MQERIAVIGLGYVGLPLSIALARKYETIGFDIDPTRIDELRSGDDRTREVTPDDLKSSSLELSSDAGSLSDRSIYIVTVPTPIDEAQPARFHRDPRCLRAGRPCPVARLDRRFRKHRLSGRDGRDLRTGAGKLVGTEMRRGFQARLQSRTHQSGRQGSPAREDHQGGSRVRTRQRSNASPPSMARSSMRASMRRRRSRSRKPPR